jgi:putative transcriptional regulator
LSPQKDFVPEESEMKLKNNLKVWRAKRDITQADLAKSIGLSRQTINSIEKGKFIPSVLSAMKISFFFETSIEEIFFIEEEK